MNQSQLIKLDVIGANPEYIVYYSIIHAVTAKMSQERTTNEIKHSRRKFKRVLLSYFTEQNRRVMTTETERIAHRIAHITLLSST